MSSTNLLASSDDEPSKDCSTNNPAAAEAAPRKRGGPRSATGRAKVRRNSLKHGFYASILLDTESSPEFQALLRALRRDLRPVGIIEDLTVQQIALEYWNDRRAMSALRRTVEFDPNNKEPFRVPNIEVLLRLHASCGQRISQLFRQLDELQRSRLERTPRAKQKEAEPQNP